MIAEGKTTAKPPSSPTLARWSFLAAALAFIITSTIFAAWYLAPWCTASHIGSQMLALYVRPAALRDASRSTLDPGRLEMFEYSFQVPWGKLGARKDLNHATFLLWNDGPMVTAYEPARMSGSDAIPGSDKAPADVFHPILVNRGYTRMAEELKATPEQVHWWDRSGSARMAFLLGMKQMELQRGTVTYRIENDELRGFQFNDHAVAPQQITLVLFDVNGRRYELRITSPPGFRKITQADINAMVASFRPIPHS